MLQQTNTKSARTVTQEATKQHGKGIVKGNPKRCLVCQQEIKKGDTWTKHTSPVDPQFGAYSIIVHTHCEKRAC